MWPPVGAFMWMQHAKSRLQEPRPPSRASIFESAYSGAIRRLSELFADIHVLFPGRVPSHIRRHIFGVIRRYPRLLPGPCAKSYSPPHIRRYPQFIHAYSATSE